MCVLFSELFVYLRIAHASRCYERLLNRVAFAKRSRLLSVNIPFALDQILHRIQMTPQGSVDQSALAVFIQVVHLYKGTSNL